MNVTDIQNVINLSLPVPLQTYKGNYDICGIRNGYGKQNWHKSWQQDYQGLFYNDSLHSYGCYQWQYEKKKYNYDGKIYANNLEGYGYMSYPDGSSYEGLFRNNERFGPGVYTYPDGSQNVGLWSGTQLVRLSEELTNEYVPILAQSLPAKVHLAQYKKIVSLVPPKPITEIVLNELNASDDVKSQRHKLCNPFIRNPNSLFFNKENYNNKYFSDQIQTVEVVTSFENGTPVLQKKTVEELLAWNNDEESIQVMKHTFLHRNYETNLTYNVASILIGERDDFRNAGDLENACMELLEASCKGDSKKMCKLITKYDINPDICDLVGNAGIHCAASKDNHQAIKVLVNFGADIDRANDEELTPLTIDLLRYIARKEDITDWEKAFFPPKVGLLLTETRQSDSKRESVDQWRSRISLKSSFDRPIHKRTQGYIFDIKCRLPGKSSKSRLKMASSVKFSKTKDGKKSEKKSKASKDKSESKSNVSKTKDSSKGKNKSDKNSENNSKLLVASSQRFGKKEGKLSRLKCTSGPTLAELEAERLKTEKEQELKKIRETILLLLHYGADPNIGIVPLPPFILAIFAQEDEMLLLLLNSGADCNIRTAYQDGSLTPLHILTALQPSHRGVNVALLLLNHDAIPNARANKEHWVEEKRKIDPENQCNDEGKTPLHLLCMRYDYEEDEEDILGLLYDTIVQNNGDPSMYYLGHTCLTLAIIRGNIRLVKRILSSYEVDPNQFLGCQMGVPLTVLILKRYKYILHEDKVNTIYELLEEYNANPFNSLPNFEGNAIEFCEEENKHMGIPKKNDSHLKAIQCLADIAKRILERHIEAKAVKYIYEYKIEFGIDHEIFEAMAKFLDIEGTLRVLQILINHDLINNHPVAMYSLIKFVYRKSGQKVRGRSKSPFKGKLEDIVSNMVKQEQPYKKVDVPSPEIDPDDEKYKVCFHCYKKTNKTLVLCPNCQLVYFCSEQCNKNNIKSNTRHKCKALFYNSELERMKSRLLRGSLLETMMDRFKKMRDEFLANPENEFNIKYAFSSLLGISFGDDKKKGKKGKSGRSKSKSRSKSGKRDKSKGKRGKSKGKSKDRKGKSKDRRGKSKGKSKDRSRGRSKGKSSKRGRSKGKHSTRGRSKGKPDRTTSPSKSRSPSQGAGHQAQLEKDKAKRTLSKTGDHLTEREKQGIALLGDKYKLMSDMSGLLDILLMNKRFLPCCILVNGQLYYRFGEGSAYCSINYSHV